MIVLRVVVLAFALVHAVGLSDAMEVACDEAGDCAEEDCEDGCPPICPSCHCARCPVSVAPEAAALDLPGAPPRAAAFPEIAAGVAGPDPREILHVPIARRV